MGENHEYFPWNDDIIMQVPTVCQKTRGCENKSWKRKMLEHECVLTSNIENLDNHTPQKVKMYTLSNFNQVYPGKLWQTDPKYKHVQLHHNAFPWLLYTQWSWKTDIYIYNIVNMKTEVYHINLPGQNPQGGACPPLISKAWMQHDSQPLQDQ